MVAFFSGWAEQIIIAVVITSLIEMLLPDNKNKKYIKIVMGIYILFSIISPFINNKEWMSLETINVDSYDLEGKGANGEVVNQDSMDERLEQLYVEELEKNIKNKVADEGYIASVCKVDAVLNGEQDKQGINKIILVVSKREDDFKEKSNIESVKKVDIKVGLSRFLDNGEIDTEEKANNDAKYLKEVLCNYYEIDKNKISVSVK